VSDSDHVQLGDFGIAAVIDDPKLTASGNLAGSPSYMAPEQAQNQPPSAATDLWGLGAMLYFAVEGREPTFSARNADYKRVQITPTTYQGYRAAVWEYTYAGGGAALRAVDLGFVTPSHGFALNFQSTASDWDRLQPVFDAFKASFRAPTS